MFPEHYSATAIAVLSIPGWVQDYTDRWTHENGTIAIVHPDGTITTFPDYYVAD